MVGFWPEIERKLEIFATEREERAIIVADDAVVAQEMVCLQIRLIYDKNCVNL